MGFHMVFMRVLMWLEPLLPTAMISLKHISLSVFLSLPSFSTITGHFLRTLPKLLTPKSFFKDPLSVKFKLIETLYILLLNTSFSCEMQKGNSHLTMFWGHHFITALCRKFNTRFPTFSKDLIFVSSKVHSLCIAPCADSRVSRSKDIGTTPSSRCGMVKPKLPAENQYLTRWWKAFEKWSMWPCPDLLSHHNQICGRAE